jgi:diguanylate cyclase (GGDEF)-like protein
LLVDLDRFKEVNDDFGHLAGDHVLVEIARRLEESTRSSDLVARFGGDEFAILLSGGVSTRSVAEVASRIREAVARPIQVQGGKAVLVGVSIGSAVAMNKGDDPLSLLHRADDALYRAKAARPPAHRAAPAFVPSAEASPVGGWSDWAEPSWSRTSLVAAQLSSGGTNFLPPFTDR